MPRGSSHYRPVRGKIMCKCCGKRPAYKNEDLCHNCLIKSFKSKKERTKRDCLDCGTTFWSEGNFNRICPACRELHIIKSGGVDEQAKCNYGGIKND